MSKITELARPEVRDLRPYQPAEYTPGLLRLNANETPWRPMGDNSDDGLNLYPEARPIRLTEALSQHYGVDPNQLLVTRGSSEAIDLLIRCFCRPGEDRVVICPPTFGMYEVYASLQGAAVDQVPLDKEQGYTLDLPALQTAVLAHTKLLFICSPNNPTGNSIPTEQIDAVCQMMDGNGIVVVDAAYVEFAESDPTRELLDRHEHVVVLRTLSKAQGLAGIRCGAVVASPEIVNLLACISTPYAYPTPCTDAALAVLANQDSLQERLATLRSERQRVVAALEKLPGIENILPSETNFILVEATDPGQFVAAAKQGGVLIRDFRWDPCTPNCLRITIGDRAQNNQLLEALTRLTDKRA